MLETPLQYNELALNDQSLRDFSSQGWWIEITSIDGIWDADVRDDRQVLPNRSGEQSGQLYYAGKTITLTGTVRAHDIANLRAGQRALQVAFGDLGAHDLFFQAMGDANPLFITCKKNQPIQMPEAQSDAGIKRSFTVSLRADDPRAYSSFESSFNFTSDLFGATKARRTYPRIWDIAGKPNRRSYSPVVGGGSSVVLFNGGTAETYPLTILNGPMTNPVIKNLTTGLQIVWSNFVLNAGQTLVVDHYQGRILLNNQTEFYDGLDVINSDFWPLPPGPNGVTVDAFSFGSDAQATIYWRDAYR